MSNRSKKVITIITLLCMLIPMMFGAVKLIVLSCNRLFKMEITVAEHCEELKEIKAMNEQLAKSISILNEQIAVLNTRLEYLIPAKGKRRN